MSVATEFAPVVYIPDAVYFQDGARAQRPLATVTELYRPSARSVAAPVRLTRRGAVVLAALVALVGVALLGIAWASAPSSASGAGSTVAPVRVTVQAGDTLWSIAARVAPRTDPRAEVAHLQQLNHLGGGASIVPGQLLRTR